MIFSTRPGKTIYAEDNRATPGPRSEPLYAQVEYESTVYTTFTLEFPTPVWGVSLWVRDINFSGSDTVSVWDRLGNELPASPFICGRYGDYTFVGVLSDDRNIRSVVFTANQLVDEQGFDDVTTVPEPGTLSLLVLGGLALISRRRR